MVLLSEEAGSIEQRLHHWLLEPLPFALIYAEHYQVCLQ